MNETLNGDENPFRGVFLSLMQRWIENIQRGNKDFATKLREAAVIAKSRERIWDMTNEISEEATWSQ